MRLAIFGGSFDPPHVGHLLAAQDAFDQLRLDRLIVVPASAQPLKSPRVTAPAVRLEMARLTFAGDPRFEVSAVEVDRGGVSFTVDTLDHFANTYPAAERFLLLGADVLATFSQWKEPDRVMSLARPVVLVRQPDDAATPLDRAGAPLMRLSTRRVDVSSTEIRARVREGRSIRGFVTDSVAALIARDGLYR